MSELFSKPISAGLLRVLAQAAAGYPNQGEMYFIARYQPDANGSYEVSPWPSHEEAHGVMKTLELSIETFGVFGPFDTTLPYPVNPHQVTVTALKVSTSNPADGFTLPLADMLYDAVFISPAAVIKFAVPYYTRVYSPKYAETMLENYLASPVGMMVHLPWSEYGEDPPPEEETPPPAPSAAAPAAWIAGIVQGDAETGYRVTPIHPPHPPRPDPAWPIA